MRLKVPEVSLLFEDPAPAFQDLTDDFLFAAIERGDDLHTLIRIDRDRQGLTVGFPVLHLQCVRLEVFDK